MPYNFVADGFQTKKLCSRLSSSEVRFYTENGRFAFLSPLWGLGATYNVHFRLTGKLVVAILLVITELSLLGVTLMHYERILIENWHFRSNRVTLTQNFR